METTKDTVTLMLNPTFSESAAAIVLSSSLTPIGTNTPQIEGLQVGYLLGLESRHARIICEQGPPLLLDLSESGATTLNGQAVGNRPVEIKLGNVLQFGEVLEYRVEPVQESDLQATELMKTSAAKLQLLLSPASDQGPQTPIVITQFPFLVAKTDGHFATYQTSLPDPVAFLSRRHAHVYESEGKLWLEDLGSTNGTTHNAERLKEQAVSLATGDEVRFGHKGFTFEVTLLVEENETTKRSLPDGTVMISSAGSFLDVYCDDLNDADPANSSADTGEQPTVLTRLSTAWLQARLRWQQWPYLWMRQLGIFVALPLLILSVLLMEITSDSRLEEVQGLLDGAQPKAALVVAVDYAAQNPEDLQGTQLMAAAFEQAVLPGWIERMQAGGPPAALAFLDTHLALAPKMADARSAALLRWMSELAQFAARSDGGISVSAATDNVQLQQLAYRWRVDSEHFARLLRRFTDAYPELQPIHAQAMSSIRSIQGTGADQLKAVEQLQTKMAALMIQSQLDSAQSFVAQFSLDHPELAGLDAFKSDLEQFLTIHSARMGLDLMAFLVATEEVAFATSFFRAQTKALPQQRLEAVGIQKIVAQAQSLWRQGQLEPAVAALEVNEDSAWKEVIALRKARYSRLCEGFTHLLSMVGTSEYPDLVIDFYAQLQKTEDRFLREALADDFTNQRDRALSNAQALAAEGVSSWRTYNQTFQGIGGGLRLEAEVSDTYREFAKQLSFSADVLRRAYRLFQLLEVSVPEALEQQTVALEEEVVRQRNALMSLRSVLGGYTVQEKLDLLPKVGRRT